MCRALASSAEVEAQLVRVLKNAKHPAFTSALKWAAEHGYGRPSQLVDLHVHDVGEQLRLARERAAKRDAESPSA